MQVREAEFRRENIDRSSIESTDILHDIETDEGKPNKDLLKKNIPNLADVLGVFVGSLHYGSWLFVIFFLGVSTGVSEGFVCWHLENLGATQLLIGIAGGIDCTCEFITFFFMKDIIAKIGHMALMSISLFSYVLRFFIYASIQNPWWALPVKAFEGMMFSCTLGCTLSYASLTVPAASLGSMVAIIQSVKSCLGQGLGVALGGLLIAQIGAVYTFYIFGGTCVIMVLLFIVAQKCST